MSIKPQLEQTKPLPKSKRLLRWLIWLLILGLAGATAALVRWNDQMQQSRQQLPELKSKILTFWEWEKDKVTLINNTAKIFARENKLSPGSPLPPSTFYEEEKSFWHFFSEKGPIQIVNSYTGKTQYLEAAAFSLLVVSDKVPNSGEPYAAVAIATSPEIIQGGFEIYPPSKPARQLIQFGNAELEKKKTQN